jgi:hypothetical protein
VLPGGRGHRQITQNRPCKNKFGGGKLKAVNRPWRVQNSSKQAVENLKPFPEKRVLFDWRLNIKLHRLHLREGRWDFTSMYRDFCLLIWRYSK